MTAIGTYSEFFRALRDRESSNDYTVKNQYGYLGAYQFGEAALIDLGYVKRDNNAYDNKFNGGFTGKNNIDSVADFLNNPVVQNAAAAEWFELLWKRIDYYGLESYAGQSLNGVALTKTGMIAASHLLGTGGLRTFIKSGGTDAGSDANNTSIVEYLELFADYGAPTKFKDNLDFANDLAGGAGFDTLFGGAEADTLFGARGRDSLDGGLGSDFLKGGGGHDTLIGALGNDTLYGGTGRDFLTEASGNGLLVGHGGNDTLAAGGGNDTLDGGPGKDHLVGGAGDDQLFGGSGRDRMWGGTNADTLKGGAQGDKLLGGNGNDILKGEAGNDTLNGGGDGDRIAGGIGNDVLTGLWGNDTLNGGAGNDTLNGGAGQDRLIGGDGTDMAVYAGDRGRYMINELRNGNVEVVDLDATFGRDVLSGIENVKFGDRAFDIDALL